MVFGGVKLSDMGTIALSNVVYALDLQDPKRKGWQKIHTEPKRTPKPGCRICFAATAFKGGLAVHGGTARAQRCLDDMWVLQTADLVCH